MTRKADDDEVFFCVCTACGLNGPARLSALWAVESARRAGWEVQGDVQLCTRCAFRVERLEKSLALKPPPDRAD